MRPHLQLAGKTYELDILARRPKLRLGVGESAISVSGDPSFGAVSLDGCEVSCTAVRDGGTVYVRLPRRMLVVKLLDPRDEAEGDAESVNSIVAPMPGSVVALNFSVGDAVAEGDVVLTIESMKLQMNIVAPRAAVIARIPVEVQSTFEKGRVLVQFESEHEA